MLRYLTFTLLLVTYSTNAAEKCAARDFQWTGGENIEWPSPATKNMYKNNGRFVSKNVIATRAVMYKDDAIVALPRYRPGVPATLAKVKLKGKNCLPSINPFPNWTIQEEGECSALQSVVDIFLDMYGVLWILDTGIINSLDNPVQQCPPKIVAINVKTGKVVKTVDISLLTNHITRLQYIVADYSPDGRAFVYLSDAANRAILVFDVISGRGYRVILPKAVTLGCTRRDVLYLNLIRRHDGKNSLFFTYLSSKNLFSIRTSHLQNGVAQGQIKDIGPKKFKVVFLGTDGSTGLYFRKEGEPDIYRWDLQDYPNKENIKKVYKGTAYALPTQVVYDYKRGCMRVLESNFPDYFQGTIGCGTNHALKIF